MAFTQKTSWGGTELTAKGWSAIAVGVLVGLYLLTAIFSAVRVVGVGEVGIVTRFGTVVGELQSGLHVIAPWPFEGMTTMNVQVQKEQQDAGAATHDLQSVTASIALNYHLTDLTAQTVFKTIGTEYKARIIDPVIQEAVKATTAQYNAEELISQRPQVEAALSERLVGKLADRGITVDNVSIVNFEFSSSFDQAIEAKQVAQQQAQKAQYDLQTAQLKAQAQDVQAKTLTAQYLQLQAIEKWDGKMPTYMGVGGSVFNIPLQGQ